MSDAGFIHDMKLVKNPHSTHRPSFWRTKSANLRYRLLNEAAQRQKNREESKKDKLGHHA
jgi:hypothetical protein